MKMNNFLELANEQNQKEIANIKESNEITNKYGLILNDKQIYNLLGKRKNILKQTTLDKVFIIQKFVQ